MFSELDVVSLRWANGGRNNPKKSEKSNFVLVVLNALESEPGSRSVIEEMLI